MTSTCNMGPVSFFARLFGSRLPPSPRTPFEAGVAALDQQRFDEASAHFAAALEAAATGAQRALVHNKRALISLQRGDRAAAIAAFVAALDADERCVPAIVNVGNLLLEDGVLDDAVAHYESALRLDEAYAPGHHNLGIAYKRLGRRADAVREFRRADRIEAGLRARSNKRIVP
jgi:tetratricopeptide (TPR) repeat protein